LRGRRIGIHGHFNPIAFWVRGMLQHEFNVPPGAIHWIADGSEDVPGWTPPSWLRIERAPAGRKMQDLLQAGELDAQIRSDSGADAAAINKVVRRLWPNYREVEGDYSNFYLETDRAMVRIATYSWLFRMEDNGIDYYCVSCETQNWKSHYSLIG
jgi:hypothetical protein